MAALHGVSQAPAKRVGMAWRFSAAVAALACAGAALAVEPGPGA
jgi:ribose transport system substrate-binding protein